MPHGHSTARFCRETRSFQHGLTVPGLGYDQLLRACLARDLGSRDGLPTIDRVTESISFSRPYGVEVGQWADWSDGKHSLTQQGFTDGSKRAEGVGAGGRQGAQTKLVYRLNNSVTILQAKVQECARASLRGGQTCGSVTICSDRASALSVLASWRTTSREVAELRRAFGLWRSNTR